MAETATAKYVPHGSTVTVKPTAMAQQHRSSPLHHFVAGWLGGSVSCALLSPLEVVKTRLQSSMAAENRMRPDRLAIHIVKTEGVSGLYRGLLPHLLGVGPSRAFYFGAYNFIKRSIGPGDSHQKGRGLMHGTALHLTAAAIASIVSATIMSPVWVVKTRLQLQQTPSEPMAAKWQRLMGRAGVSSATMEPHPQSLAGVAPFAGMSAQAAGASAAPHAPNVHAPYSGIAHAFARIYREEGWRAFYRGLGASYLGVIETALQFAVYAALKEKVVEAKEVTLRQAIARGERPSGLSSSSSSNDVRRAAYTSTVAFCTSAAAKLVAAVATYPHEVIRTRLREQRGTGASMKYTGVMQTISTIYKVEGMAGLYGGMSVHLLRTVPNAAILLMVVERFVGGEV